MKTLKILAVSALCLGLLAGLTVAYAGVNCDKNKTASTAAAGVGCCAKGATATAAVTTSATVTTASVTGTVCPHATATTASVGGVGCSHGAAMTAGAGCPAAAAAMAANISPSDIDIEAVRMPSGMMAVLYTGKTEAAAKYLAIQAQNGCASFGCPITREMAANEHCKVQMAAVSNGVLVLVQSDDSQVLDGYAKKIEVAMNTTPSEAPATKSE